VIDRVGLHALQYGEHALHVGHVAFAVDADGVVAVGA